MVSGSEETFFSKKEPRTSKMPMEAHLKARASMSRERAAQALVSHEVVDITRAVDKPTKKVWKGGKAPKIVVAIAEALVFHKNVPETSEQFPQAARSPCQELIFTDVSISAWGAMLEGTLLQGHWSVQEFKLPIHCLEFQAILLAFLVISNCIQGSHVLIRTNNIVTKSYFNFN
uniref:Uncharacterized protein n=1 Tax=Sphaerodactylus townsendi TaxID=933632 RepID=A0ACB8F4F1_9SAUR